MTQVDSSGQLSLLAAHQTSSLSLLRDEARECRLCPLWETGQQTVFGVGRSDARLMLVGEAPGAQEDRQGEPFVGAAGALLNELLAAAGIDRSTAYVTNAVKHRPSVDDGRARRNRAPRQREIRACQPWLEAEIRLIKPAAIVCLGAVPARVVLGKEFRLTEMRGQWRPSPYVDHAMATLHPAYLLRQQEPETLAKLRSQVIQDFQVAAAWIRQVDR